MDDLTDQTLMGLPEFRNLLHLSPSSERRLRSEEEDWPPHMVVGRKVFYFRDGVREFLARQEVASSGVRGGLEMATSEVAAAVAQAPAFTAEQIQWLRAVISGGFEPHVPDDPGSSIGARRDGGH